MGSWQALFFGTLQAVIKNRKNGPIMMFCWAWRLICGWSYLHGWTPRPPSRVRICVWRVLCLCIGVWIDGHGNWAPASVLEDEKWLLTAPFRHSACETTTFRLIVSMSCPQNHAKIPLQEGSLNCSSESSIHLRYYHVIWPEICPHVPDNDQPFSTAFCVRSFTSRK